MSRLILQMQTSIDGYVDSTVPQARWQLWDWGPDWPWTADLRADFNAVFARASGIVLSRPMVDQGYLAHWRQIAATHRDEEDYDFARRIETLPKYVLTSSRPQSEWTSTTVLQGALADTVDQARQDAGGDLLCFGGAGFARALLQSNLVDELQLFTNPGVAGAGASIFDASMISSSYRGVDARAYSCGIVVTRWAKRPPHADL